MLRIIMIIVILGVGMSLVLRIEDFGWSDPLPIHTQETIEAVVPQRNIRTRSVELMKTGPNQAFWHWTREDHKNSYQLLQRVVDVWGAREYPVQDYVVYGYQAKEETPFSWIAVPYYPWMTHFLTSKPSQMSTLFWLTLSTTFADQVERLEEQAEWKEALKHSAILERNPTINPQALLLQEARIKVQKIVETDLSMLFYNYNPLKTGGEEIQFLILPKQGKKTFRDLSEEEYIDMMEMQGQVIDWGRKERDLDMVHVFHKNGRPAGQSTEPFHIHVVMLTKESNDLVSRVYMLFNMIGFSTPLEDTETQRRALKYRAELISRFPSTLQYFKRRLSCPVEASARKRRLENSDFCYYLRRRF